MSPCMSLGRSLYRIHDRDPKLGCHAVSGFEEADKWSADKWGIFWTVNEFAGPRQKQNCKRVLAWAIDLDEGSKPEQLERIRRVPVTPSAIIETARGYHVYFDAMPGADPDNYRDILERLVEKYRADKNAKDLCRILRVPAYCHWKGKQPFVVKLVFASECAYSEAEMRKAFPAEEHAEVEFEQKAALRQALKVSGNGDLWEKIWSLDCERALERLSGTPAVNGERFSFKRTSNGNLNILVNDKGTSCWIDKNKRIGSHDSGGPTIFQWVDWYQRNKKRTTQLIKEIFPEVTK